MSNSVNRGLVCFRGGERRLFTTRPPFCIRVWRSVWEGFCVNFVCRFRGFAFCFPQILTGWIVGLFFTFCFVLGFVLFLLVYWCSLVCFIFRSNIGGLLSLLSQIRYGLVYYFVSVLTLVYFLGNIVNLEQ